MVRKASFFGFFLLLLTLQTGCSSLLYYPRVQKVKFYDPSQVNLQQEEIEFADEAGTRLHGWWFSSKQRPSKGTLVFFHGNAENLTTHFLNFSWLPEKGYDYFIFDYPGYGVSQGDPSPRTTVMAGKAALKWVHEQKDKRPLIVYGQSLGGNIAFRSFLETKDEIPYRALVLDGTFLSYRSIAREKASEGWITWIFQPFAWLSFSDKYAPEHIEKRAPVPLLVIHGEKDAVIPIQFGQEIFDQSPEPKQIWRIPDGQHNSTFWQHERAYRQKFLDYLESLPR